ncbi:PAS domain-containing sensor histidine kinase [Ramlibacter tataouinensis]|uniref:sensor histidine kinase n=1 Tax=Ramlibacter tataouinensis TaxID=94132 RepID=UPI003F7F38D8
MAAPTDPPTDPPADPPITIETTLEHRLQLLIEAVEDYGIFVLDPGGHVVSWNSGAEKLKGWTRDEIVGQHFSIFYPPEAVATGWPQEELRRTMRDGRFEDEGWRVRKDGSRFWANVVITALREPGTGELTGFAKVTRDLTERRRHEEALRASEESFRLLVEGISDHAVVMLDPEGRVRSWNRGAEVINGYSGSEIMGRHFSIFFSPNDRAAGKPERELALARADGRFEDEGWRVRKDGSRFWGRVLVTPIRASSGQLAGYAKVTQDLSVQRKIADLERSTRRMNEFLAMLAHELRNPLAPIRNAVTIMQKMDAQLPAPVQRMRDVIDRQLTQMTRLVDDLLDVSRLTTGKIKLRREPVDMADVIARSVETTRPLIESRAHALAIDVPPGPHTVDGDPTRLAQVLQNLLVNAAKYTTEGGRIAVVLHRQPDSVEIAVTDSGRGIPREELEHIFDLFAQGEAGLSPTATDTGLGVGLALARALVQMHGGSMSAHSDGAGKGATFAFRLPLAGARPAGKGSSAG